MEFEYLFQRTAVGVIDINDISSCCIEAFNDLGQCYYLLTKTECGFVKVMTFGPTMPDFPGMTPPNYEVCFKRMEYNKGKIIKEITSFLQNPKARITQAVEQSSEVAMSNFIGIADYFKDGGF